MASQDLDRRADILEEQVKGLQELPAKVDALASQIAQLHGAMDVGFSALDTELGSGINTLATTLRAEMRRRDRRTRRYMRVLHEEVIDRIKTLGDARTPPSD